MPHVAIDFGTREATSLRAREDIDSFAEVVCGDSIASKTVS